MPNLIVIATDVRFWERRTGAHLRISSLVQWLVESGYPVEVCFMSDLTPDDQKAIQTQDLRVWSLIDNWRPVGLWESLVWQVKCLLNAILPNSNSKSEPPFRSLSDYRNPLLQKRFHQYLDQKQPEAVLVEYIHLAYLKDSLPLRRLPAWILDTHDLLSKRCLQFKEAGFRHWLEVSAEEEAQIVREFDLVVAIQSQEAESFVSMVDCSTKVVTAGHPAISIPNLDSDSRPGNGTKHNLGYFASANAANLHAITGWLDSVWTRLVESNVDAKLVVGGNICESLSAKSIPGNVQLIGPVERPEDFYQQVDVVINPVEIGTGLKIKSVEALAFGKVLLSSQHGVDGLAEPMGGQEPWIVCKSADQWVEAIHAMLGDNKRQVQIRELAKEYVAKQLSPNVVYREFDAALKMLLKSADQ